MPQFQHLTHLPYFEHNMNFLSKSKTVTFTLFSAFHHIVILKYLFNACHQVQLKSRKVLILIPKMTHLLHIERNNTNCP